jgi:hypothetical protein
MAGFKISFDVNIRLYEYWHEQVKIRKKRWNNKEIKQLYWKEICKQKVRKKGGGPCHERLWFYIFFPVSDLRKLALSTTLHPKCLSLGQKIIMCTNSRQLSKKSYDVFISVFYQN